MSSKLCLHPKLEMVECDSDLSGMDYWACPDCGKEFKAECAFDLGNHVNRNPWQRPLDAELQEVK